MVIINDKSVTCNDLREIKKKIYTQGLRGQKYIVDVCEKNTGTINDTYLMKYTNEGPIFTKQIYSRWKENKEESKVKQYSIFIN